MLPFFLGAVLDLVGLISIVTLLVGLISNLQPLFERVRNSCRACQQPEGRALLLWTTGLIPTAWVAAAVHYYDNLFKVWEFMGTWFEEQPVNRPVYALLHLYLFFLLVFGVYAVAITGFEIFRNFKVVRDIFMIARFSTRRYQAIEDTEAQNVFSCPDPIELVTENISAVGNECNTSSLQPAGDLAAIHQQSDEDIAPTDFRIDESEDPMEEDFLYSFDPHAPLDQLETVNHPVR